MKNKIIVILIIIIFSVSLYFLSSNSIQNHIRNYQQKNTLSGVILAAKGDTILYHKAFGYANNEKKIKNTINHEFLIGSITKQITAAAILLLVDRGLLDLHMPLSTYILPNNEIWKNKMPEWANLITSHDLLTHTSGLIEYVNLPEFPAFYENIHHSKELIQLFMDYPLKFKPGNTYEYSGSGYNVLGLLIEVISGMSYKEFLRESFFIPLNLKNIYVGNGFLSAIEEKNSNISIGYQLDKKQIKKAGEVNLSTAFAEASVISTATDLYRWLIALYSHKIISKESLHKMTTSYITTKNGEGVGYGLFMDKSLGYSVYVHTGRIDGYESIALYNPANQAIVVILSNIMGSSIYSLAYELISLIQ
jgi:CubicO group peptidase (beta-lactamase class C family)